MAVQAATTAKKTRGVGPVTISYIDASNKEAKRVPDSVSQVKVADKAGKAKNYSVDGLPPAIRNMLAASALAKRMDIFVRNSVDDAGKVNVIDCADEVYASLKDGKFYTRGEGKGGPGRTFDMDKWVAIARLTQDLRVKNDKTGKVKPATEKQLAEFRMSLESLQGKERNAKLLAWIKNPVVKLAKATWEAQQAKKQADAGDFEEDDDTLF